MKRKIKQGNTKNITLVVGDMASCYAQRTLYDHLSENPIFNISLREEMHAVSNHNILPSSLLTTEPGFSVGMHHDFPTGKPANVEIDVAILKNCAKPYTEAQKAEIKTKFGIKKDETVITIGYPQTNAQLAKRIFDVFKNTKIFASGTSSCSFENYMSHVTFTGLGLLKQAYAVADIALDGSCIDTSKNRMHNFVEMTEGGPLFFVPPTETRQYGYQTFVDIGIMNICKDAEEIIGRIKTYLENTEPDEHVKKRAEHIQDAREKYLPVIESIILNKLGLADVIESDLTITEINGCTRILHPESNWTDNNVYFDGQ
ncbi:MAG: hypothetical protein Q8O89_07420 [Nanoarchaeota archaeon]|nr:hypothetical protein [Nanoarchaeota archaeon]